MKTNEILVLVVLSNRSIKKPKDRFSLSDPSSPTSFFFFPLMNELLFIDPCIYKASRLYIYHCKVGSYSQAPFCKGKRGRKWACNYQDSRWTFCSILESEKAKGCKSNQKIIKFVMITNGSVSYLFTLFDIVQLLPPAVYLFQILRLNIEKNE